ncbi:MAG: patatin-like phospholipase family protein [Myxococcota bacterium]
MSQSALPVPAAPPSEREDALLRLQRMETKLVVGLFDHPGVVSRKTEHQLRYAIGLAALDTFQPGAARRGRRNQNPDVRVRTPRLARWRERLPEVLADTLLHTTDSKRRVETAAEKLQPLLPLMARTRDEILEKYANDFSARHLDQEIGIKTLVNVAGGGGGSAYVYIGAWEVLQAAGLIPGYLIGASMGAVLGLFRALRRDGDLDEYVALAKGLKPEEIFRFVSLRTQYGLPGVMRLVLRGGIGSALSNQSGAPLRIPDLEIPYEAVVAGLRRSAVREGLEGYARSHHLHEDKRPGALQMRAQIAAQLVRMVGFFNPRAAQEIVIGADDLTGDFDAVDAAGFSAAIPGILHYDVSEEDSPMHAPLTDLFEREEVVALVDGGVANNVPSRIAWRQVRAGKIGTRNAFVLAFDCFHPQIGMGHVWLQPITRLIALQVALNQRYAQKRIEFKPTLSPLNLLPRAREIDRAVAWGRAQMARELPRIQKYFERVRWVPPDEG